MTGRVACLLSFLFAPWGPMSAQPVPGPGERVRILQSDDVRLTGLVGDWTEDSFELVLDSGGGTRTITAASIVELERSLGQRRNVGKYLGISAAAGAVIGGVAGAVMPLCVDRGGWFDCFLEPTQRRDAVALGIFGGAIAGMVPGLVIGLVKRDEAWEVTPIPGPDQARVILRPVLGQQLGFVGSWTIGP